MEQTQLLETIANWPDWKIKSLLLDETDLQLLKIINEWRIAHNLQPCK